jgi:hypothetical protein
MYQTRWQDIQFSSFAELSSTNLAAPEFYQAFYEAFFRRYQNWGQLSEDWRGRKERCAELIVTRSRAGSKILSVGCGLGVMEHYLHAENPQLDLFIHEVAPAAWRWVGADFPDERKFLGTIPDCLPKDMRFDLVYLAAVDYALDDDALIGLLAAIKPFLIGGGAGAGCLLISASFQDTPATLKDKAVSLVRGLATALSAVLDSCGLRSRGQFWGWSRTRDDYRSLLRRAGYGDIEDGFIDAGSRQQYWIAGR